MIAWTELPSTKTRHNGTSWRASHNDYDLEIVEHRDDEGVCYTWVARRPDGTATSNRDETLERAKGWAWAIAETKT